MTNKNSKKSSLPASTEGNNSEWLKKLPLFLSALSILATITIGVLSILNTRAIAQLDHVVYVPNLQYRFAQSQAGYISLEVRNYGYSSAQKVIVNFNWEEIEIKDCAPSPPYQNLSPIEPIVKQNLSYQLDSLSIGGVFKIECKVYPFDPSEAETSQTILEDIPQPLYINTSQPFYIVPAETQRPRLVVSQIELTQDMLNVIVVAENSAPAIEIERPKTIIASMLYFESSATPIP